MNSQATVHKHVADIQGSVKGTLGMVQGRTPMQCTYTFGM